MTENKQTMQVVVAAVEACNAVAVPDSLRAVLVADLRPIADRLDEYTATAEAFTVANEADARRGALMESAIAADIKAVREHEVVARITDGLHKLHRQWTGLRGMFTDPLDAARKQIRGKVIAWQEAERKKAEEQQRKLQAEAEARAAAERAKAEAAARRQREIEEAARRKAEDARRAAAEADARKRARLIAEANAAERKAAAAAVKAEAQAEQAAAVVAPTVHVEAPQADIRTSRVWTVADIDDAAFYAALASRQDLRGFVKIDTTRLARAKAANPSMDVPGVEFKQVVR